MEKNRSLRTASGLFVLVLLTICVVGATYAKYVTTGTASDTARVAKWGVTVTMSNDNDIFKSVYTKDATSDQYTSITNSVESSTASSSDNKVVAPGTSGSHTITISGKPEVAFNLNIDVATTNTVKVSSNTELIMPSGMFETEEIKVKPTADYEPITFKIEKPGTTEGSWVTLSLNDSGMVVDTGGTKTAEKLTLEQLKTALSSLSKAYGANEAVNEEYKITWKWPFNTEFSSYTGDSGYKTYDDADVLDTYLGKESTAKEAYTITVSATQID